MSIKNAGGLYALNGRRDFFDGLGLSALTEVRDTLYEFRHKLCHLVIADCQLPIAGFRVSLALQSTIRISNQQSAISNQ
ncbi:MAG TPA: hypothetical protein VKB46_18080, partial [Pyrinomonadaceae bacterium]|nr:hypothetical protein [Pyrinomonadaceae bacterium]